MTSQERDLVLRALNKLVRAVRTSPRVKRLHDPGCGQHEVDERHIGCRACEGVPAPTDDLQKAMTEAVELLSGE